MSTIRCSGCLFNPLRALPSLHCRLSLTARGTQIIRTSYFLAPTKHTRKEQIFSRSHPPFCRIMNESASGAGASSGTIAHACTSNSTSSNGGSSSSAAAVTSSLFKCEAKSKKKQSTAYGYSNRKRKQQDGKGKGKGGKKKNFRKKYSNDDDPSNSIPNKGSYADIAMQKMFGVEVKKRVVDADAPRAPKKKIALLVAFIGENYTGFQINPGIKSIQAEMELALYKSGYLSEANFGHPQKYGWSNSARTDKGVHACAQVVSCWLQLTTSNLDEVRESINAALPNDICVLDVCRTTRSFCARTQRDRVRYMYMLPSFLLMPTNDLRTLCKRKGCHENSRPANDPLSADEIDILRPEVSKFRASAENIDKLKAALKAYEGTHSFHNFTRSLKSTDGSAKRYIESFDVLDPVTDENGVEWIPTIVFGQSFLLNQIRKMIALAVDVARGAAEFDTMEDSMTKRVMKLGVAPAEGLFLDMSYFHTYNQRKKPDQPLDWTLEGKPAVERRKKFKEERIMKHIMAQEIKEDNFLRYVYVQEYHWERERYLPLPTSNGDGNTRVRSTNEKDTDEDTSS